MHYKNIRENFLPDELEEKLLTEIILEVSVPNFVIPSYREKWKRNQVYQPLQYSFSGETYYDFLSEEMLNILEYSIAIAEIFKLETITSDMLVYSCLHPQFFLKNILKKAGITPFSVGEKLKKKWDKKTFNLKETTRENLIWYGSKLIQNLFFNSLNACNKLLLGKFKNILDNKKTGKEKKLVEKDLNSNIIFSNEIEEILKRSAINSQKRFKTPIITPEIFFITLMEAKNSRGSKLLRKIIRTKIQWMTLKYRLYKKIYKFAKKKKFCIHGSLKYFDMILESRIPKHPNYLALVEEPSTHFSTTLRFRNRIIDNSLQKEFVAEIQKDVYFDLLSLSQQLYDQKENIFEKNLDKKN